MKMDRLPVYFLAILFVVQLNKAELTNNQLKVYESYKAFYYDPVGNLTLKSEIEDSSRLPNTRIGFNSLPCSCQEMSCGCCAGINITRIKFDQKACANFTYDPYDFAIKMNVHMNDRKIFSNKISAKNPPPICMPLPYIPIVDFCIRFHDIFMPGNNLQACIDFETRVVQSPVMVLHFDCVRAGADGIAWLKPEDNGGLDGQEDASPMIAEPEVYDEVDFEMSDPEVPLANTSSSSTQDDEENIGQLKL